MQFIPFDGLYVYFRYDSKSTVMVVSNSNDKAVDIKMDRFKERTSGFVKMKNIHSGIVTDLKDFSIEAKESGVYELMK